METLEIMEVQNRKAKNTIDFLITTCVDIKCSQGDDGEEEINKILEVIENLSDYYDIEINKENIMNMINR